MENLTSKQSNLPLAPYRVLDLSTERGYVCGKILAELGAEVIKIEPPGGDPGRNNGPFYHDSPDKNKSLFFFAYNTNKRSITLNIEATDGQEIFKRLVKTADFVIESFDPGYLDKLGLGYSFLQKLNPRVIMVSVTPFGQTGPRKNWKASDITEIAMSGLSHITGSPEKPPVRISIDQGHIVAGYQAAMGAMISHYYRQSTGKGQQVDTSIQESLLISALTVPQAWDLQKFIWPREGAYLSRSGKKIRYLWACQDGYITWRIFGGGLGVKTRALVEWMESEGKAGELSGVEWTKVDYLSTSAETFDRWQDIFSSFFKTHTKGELCQKALDKGIVLLPVSTPKDLLSDKQLVARNFWLEVKHDELGSTLVYPGSAFKSSEYSTELFRAPLIGEHNFDVYEKEMGYSRQEMTILKNAAVI
jgi:crotonobetainyl-CoA:carnitine CoA-transferase CaiB-like acyl-CoA transferase